MVVCDDRGVVGRSLGNAGGGLYLRFTCRIDDRFGDKLDAPRALRKAVIGLQLHQHEKIVVLPEEGSRHVQAPLGTHAGPVATKVETIQKGHTLCPRVEPQKAVGGGLALWQREVCRVHRQSLAVVGVPSAQFLNGLSVSSPSGVGQVDRPHLPTRQMSAVQGHILHDALIRWFGQ